jgi:hypothetical protein
VIGLTCLPLSLNVHDASSRADPGADVRKSLWRHLGTLAHGAGNRAGRAPQMHGGADGPTIRIA